MTDKAEGTRRVYQIDPKGLAAVRRWLDQFWDDALTSFQAALDQQSSTDNEKDKT